MKYKFNEDNIIQQIQRYVDGTYERHYAIIAIALEDTKYHLGEDKNS